MKRLVVIALCIAAFALPPATARAATHTVSIQTGSGNEYNPSTIVVHIGDSVEWTNDDTPGGLLGGRKQHTVTANDGSFDSGKLDVGASFTFRFTTAGSFTYFCQYHRWTGTVVVLAPRSSHAPAPTPTPTPSRSRKATSTRSASPSPSPGASTGATPTPSIDASTVGRDSSSSTGTIVSIAIVAIVVLMLLGYVVYVRLIRER